MVETVQGRDVTIVFRRQALCAFAQLRAEPSRGVCAECAGGMDLPRCGPGGGSGVRIGQYSPLGRDPGAGNAGAVGRMRRRW